MADYPAFENRLQAILNLRRRPVAIAFRSEAPDNVEKFEGVTPSGCSFWRLAAEGRTFYTVPSDHFNCPVGAYTHNVPLPDARAHELPDVLGIMTGIGYLKMEEVPGIPVLSETPGAIVYAPLGDTPVAPDVVMFIGTPSKLMLLEEAAMQAGAASKLPLFARPTCAAIPAAMAHGTVISAGCIGNRVYTDTGDDELYAAVPGTALARIVDALASIHRANAVLLEYHRGRRQALATV